MTLTYVCYGVAYFLVGPKSVAISDSLRAGQSSSCFETRWRRESYNRPERLWGPLSLLNNEYRLITGGNPAEAWCSRNTHF